MAPVRDPVDFKGFPRQALVAASRDPRALLRRLRRPVSAGRLPENWEGSQLLGQAI